MMSPMEKEEDKHSGIILASIWIESDPIIEAFTARSTRVLGQGK